LNFFPIAGLNHTAAELTKLPLSKQGIARRRMARGQPLDIGFQRMHRYQVGWMCLLAACQKT
jgi:hypothetical protein